MPTSFARTICITCSQSLYGCLAGCKSSHHRRSRNQQQQHHHRRRQHCQRVAQTQKLVHKNVVMPCQSGDFGTMFEFDLGPRFHLGFGAQNRQKSNRKWQTEICVCVCVHTILI